MNTIHQHIKYFFIILMDRIGKRVFSFLCTHYYKIYYVTSLEQGSFRLLSSFDANGKEGGRGRHGTDSKKNVLGKNAREGEVGKSDTVTAILEKTLYFIFGILIVLFVIFLLLLTQRLPQLIRSL